MTENRPFPLTPMQRDTALVIAEFNTMLGRTPTFAELADELDTGKGRAADLVNALIERGWLEPYPTGAQNALRIRPRALELLAATPLTEHEVELTDLARRVVGARSVS